MLPEFNSEGDLPSGVQRAGWHEFQSRFGLATARRVWLFGRLQALVEPLRRLANCARLRLGQLRYDEAGAQDLDILLIMDEDFEVERVARRPRSLRFHPGQAPIRIRCLLARVSIGEEVLQIWLETYQTSRTFRKRGIVELELM